MTTGAVAPGPHSAGDPASTPDPATPLRPTDVRELQAIVRDAIARKQRLRIVGRGMWLDAGRPVTDAQRVSLDGVTGIVDYTPGDLTLTARGGTTLAEIAAATQAHGQWLALSPWGGDGGSLGATTATATAGPVSGAFGTPRDIVIGLEAVTGTGEIIRGGGRVVKNVAGFDLTRLMVGAWGTLGVVTEVSVRLRGLPEHDVTVAFAAPGTLPLLTEVLTRLRSAAIAPIASEIVSAAVASHFGLAAQPTILARLVGNAESVTAQQAAVSEIADTTELSTDVWTALRVADPRDATVVRFSAPVGRFAELWLWADRLANAGEGHAHGSISRSSARVILPHANGTLPDGVADLLRPAPANTRIFERLPASLWPSLAPSAVVDRLSLGIRSAFDPHRLLNPGILGEHQA